MGEYSREFYAQKWHNLKNLTRSTGREVQILVVTKNQDIEKLRILYSIGVRDFAENKVQELLSKISEINFPDLRWHFIGHLQSNKVRTLLQLKNLVSIHSVDSLKLLKVLLANQSEIQGRNLDLYFQVNISGEEEKQGFSNFLELKEAVSFFLNSPEVGGFRLKGLMGMGPIRSESFSLDAIKAFKSLADMRGALLEDFGINLKLSMGMSSDFKEALDCGSDVLRIGSYLFK